MVQFVSEVYELKDMGAGGARCAFNLLLHIGPNAHGDLEASMKMSGYGGHEGPFAEMDEAMLSVIALREDSDCKGKDEGLDLPVVRHRWSRADADVGVFKTGRPNKQQRGQIERQKAAWVKERDAEARERRLVTGFGMRLKS